MAKHRITFLADFVDAMFRWDRLKRGDPEVVTRQALSRPPEERIVAACSVLMERIGDAARIAVAEQALAAYRQLGETEKVRFFNLLKDDYGIDAEKVRLAFDRWNEAPCAETAAGLFRVTEPSRQTLLRRLNLWPGATSELVAMRNDLLCAIKKDPSLAPVDEDFAHVFSSWFNRGFLTMRRIDWGTPAALLEKFMDYESVHLMKGWEDLRRRLVQADRRMYAFFHPATGDEPLIFVEIALTKGVPSSIASILDAPIPGEGVDPDTAVFYSINNSLPGLKGISFGNFLIKQVVADLSDELPGLKTFVTLSPAPGFAAWLERNENDRAVALATALKSGNWIDDADEQKKLHPDVQAMAARYFVTERNRNGLPPDPVARFHLGNGASAWRINWPADFSEAALKRSHGLMINYLYELDAIEAQHEGYVRQGNVAHGRSLADALASSSQLLKQ